MYLYSVYVVTHYTEIIVFNSVHNLGKIYQVSEYGFTVSCGAQFCLRKIFFAADTEQRRNSREQSDFQIH